MKTKPAPDAAVMPAEREIAAQVTTSPDVPAPDGVIVGDAQPLPMAADPYPLRRPVLDLARAQGVSAFDLAGMTAQAGWPAGSVHDATAPYEVSDADFAAALAAFRGMKVG